MIVYEYRLNSAASLRLSSSLAGGLHLSRPYPSYVQCNFVRTCSPLAARAFQIHPNLARYSSPVTISDLQCKSGNSPVIQLELCLASFGWPLLLNSRKDTCCAAQTTLNCATLPSQSQCHCSFRVVGVAASFGPGNNGSAR